MSDIVVAAENHPRLTIVQWIVAFTATLVARRLGRLAPDRLERVLRRISRSARPASAEQALAARRAVTAVSVRCAGRWCLDRSLATALVTRAAGCWPEWRTGVALRPFRAHAWVSVDGEPVGEPDGLRATFTPVLTVAAGSEVRR